MFNWTSHGLQNRQTGNSFRRNLNKVICMPFRLKSYPVPGNWLRIFGEFQCGPQNNYKRKKNNKTPLWDAFASKWPTDWWVGGYTVFGRMGMDWRTSSLRSGSHACHSHSHRAGTIYRHSIRCSIVLFGNEPTGMERPSQPLIPSPRPGTVYIPLSALRLFIRNAISKFFSTTSSALRTRCMPKTAF